MTFRSNSSSCHPHDDVMMMMAIIYRVSQKKYFPDIRGLQSFGPLCTVLEQCQIILDTSESYGPFLILWTNLDRFGRVGPVDNHGLFGPFGLGQVWTVGGPFRLFGPPLSVPHQTVQNGPHGSKWSKLSKWSKQSKTVQTVQNGPNGPSGPK